MKKEDGQQPGEQPANEPRKRAGAFFIAASMLGWAFLRRPGRKRAVAKQAGEIGTAARREEMKQAGGTPITVESDAETMRRRKVGTPLIVLSGLVGLGAGVWFLCLYWTGGSNELLGGSLAICLGGFGVLLVLYAHWMVRRQEVIAPREPVAPPESTQRRELFETYSAGAHDVERRSLLKWMGAGAVGVFAAMFISMFRSMARTSPESLFGVVWKQGDRLMTLDGKPMTVDSLQQGGMAVVFPENSIGSERSQTVLLRVDPKLLHLPQGRQNWAPKGYLAYSRVCTHAGCVVGMYEATSKLLLCPCHQSTFDVLRGAVPTGGPAARSLPQLPLYAASDGTLRAAGELTSPPGPGFTGMPS